jgi:hypothetical protein
MPTPVTLPVPSVIDQHRSETLGTVVFSPAFTLGGQPKGILVQALTQNIRYTLSAGQAPTAAIGFQLITGNDPIFIPLGTGMTPRFFREASGAILQYQWTGETA